MYGLGLENNAVRLGGAGAASGTTEVSGAVFDTTGYDSVIIIARIGTANAGNFVKAQFGDASDGSDMADLAGTKVVAAANGQLAVLEVVKPTKRYLRGNVIRAGAATVTGDIIYIGVNGTPAPVINQITNTLITKSVLSPAAGTP
jgi:hypothetical protein